MKKLLFVIAVAVLSAPAFAQESKTEKKTEMKTEVTTKHECYAMKESKLMHCSGTDAKPIQASVALKNGTVLSPEGTMKTKDGNVTQLKDGQCVTLMGSVGDCEEMHASMMDEHKTKEEKMK